MRIVSLVPSLTYDLCALGRREELVGCTKFCVSPPGLHKTATLVGGTKDPDLALVRDLAPTHVLVNSEENKPEHVAELKREFHLLETFPKGPDDVPALLETLGGFLDVREESLRQANRIREALARARERVAERSDRSAGRGRFLYYIWKNPYMVASRDTYISRIFEIAGLENAAPQTSRYPALPLEEAAALRPDWIFLSSEPYPFRKRDASALREEWPESPAALKVDGQIFSWHGVLLLNALEALEAWLADQETKAIRAFSA